METQTNNLSRFNVYVRVRPFIEDDYELKQEENLENSISISIDKVH